MLPSATFTQVTDDGTPSPEWASPDEVKPIARLRIEPSDFPFLKQVLGLNPAALRALSEADAPGWPWLYDSYLFPISEPF